MQFGCHFAVDVVWQARHQGVIGPTGEEDIVSLFDPRAVRCELDGDCGHYDNAGKGPRFRGRRHAAHRQGRRRNQQ